MPELPRSSTPDPARSGRRPRPLDMPGPVFDDVNLRAMARMARRGKHVLAFEQPVNWSRRPPGRQHQGPVRNRLVARHADFALQRLGRTGSTWLSSIGIARLRRSGVIFLGRKRENSSNRPSACRKSPGQSVRREIAFDRHPRNLDIGTPGGSMEKREILQWRGGHRSGETRAGATKRL